MTPTLGVAFVAGVLSFLSPCVLPLVPTYLAYIGGSGAAKRALVLRNAALFVLGFSLVFIAMGASASALGSILREHRSVLMIVGGVLVIAFGLVMLGVIRLPLLYRDTRRPLGADANPQTPWGAVALGSAFAFAWTPCIGPVLGAILTIAGASGTLTTGVGLLAVYSLGLAVPFMLAALAFEPFLRMSRGLRPYLPWFERVAGGLLVIVGIMMVTGTFTALNNLLLRLTPDWLFQRI
ncbi:MAG: cytochrome c biogenesis protein CcdA [Trueperaceae bacterium]|nr:MAG: cytochrome c biogenesis protein CcdA [Trueperaceae bacterium]